MKLTSPLVFALLVLFTSLCSQTVAQDGKSCEAQATVETENPTGSQGYGKASVKLQNGQSPYRVIFYDSLTGRQLQKDLSKSSIENLKKGSYYCIVADSRGCIKKIEFQIQ
jgi:hypothetical protein